MDYLVVCTVALLAGGLTLIAGTVGVIAFLAFFAGTEVGIQGYASLSQIGVAKFTAFISAYFNTREVAPLVSSIALAATVGCGYTARLGAMRISEEIDALEVMGIPSLPYLVTTRMIAAFIAVIPLYVVALSASYLSPRLITTMLYGQSAGTYDHYFLQFLPPVDMLWSFFKLIVLAVAIILIHCYYGYTASGGPAGVGMAWCSAGPGERPWIAAASLLLPAAALAYAAGALRAARAPHLGETP